MERVLLVAELARGIVRPVPDDLLPVYLAAL
jgi:hypothetical protein